MSVGGRRLHDDERELWDGVTRAVKPLGPRTKTETVLPSATVRAPRKAEPKPKSQSTSDIAAAAPVKSAKPQSLRLPALAPLSRRTKQRLARGP
jgi:hypothetical protein